MNDDENNENNLTSLNNIIITTILENKTILLSAVLLIVGSVIGGIIFPRMYGDFASNIPDNILKFNFIDILIVVLPYIVSELLYYVCDTIDAYAFPKIELSIIKRLSNKVIKSVKTTKHEINSNELILQLKKILDMRHIYYMITSYVLPPILISLGISFYFGMSNISFGISTFVILALVFIILINMSNKCFDKTQHNEHQIDNFCEDVYDVFNNIDPIIVAGMTKEELDRIENKKNELYKHMSGKDLCNGQLKFVFFIAYFIVMIILNGLGMKLYYDKKIDKSVLVGIFFMVLTLIQHYDSMIYELHNISSHVGIYRHLQQYFDNFTINNTKLKTDFKSDNYDIEFKNITANYKDKKIFDKLNLIINENDFVGIMGEIGSGKSTILKILAGIMKYEGDIMIGNKNIKDYDISEIISYIPQNPKLFNRTILENITYGTDYNIDKINKIILEFDLVNFFKSFPKGLDTKVGKDGLNISGGQREIIYILRAIIQDKKIILMDEPSGNLNDDYRDIFMNIVKNLTNKTIIIVTHDDKILDLFNRIIVMDKGKIKDDII